MNDFYEQFRTANHSRTTKQMMGNGFYCTAHPGNDFQNAQSTGNGFYCTAHTGNDFHIAHSTGNDFYCTAHPGNGFRSQ